MSEAEVARKVQSVCEKLSRSARVMGLYDQVKVGDKIIALLPDELVEETNRSLVAVDSVRGESFMVVWCYMDGRLQGISLRNGDQKELYLDTIAFPTDYEAAYKGSQQQPGKEEKEVEDQFEWVLKNDNRVMTMDLSAEDLKIVFDSLSTDCCVEQWWCGEWRHSTACHLVPSCVYRVKRKVKDTPLNIAWEWVDAKWNYAAMDKSARVFLYDEEPYLPCEEAMRQWCAREDYHMYDPPALTTDDIDWKRSLTKRP